MSGRLHEWQRHGRVVRLLVTRSCYRLEVEEAGRPSRFLSVPFDVARSLAAALLAADAEHYRERLPGFVESEARCVEKNARSCARGDAQVCGAASTSEDGWLSQNTVRSACIGGVSPPFSRVEAAGRRCITKTPAQNLGVARV